jgi:hypothetical protein
VAQGENVEDELASLIFKKINQPKMFHRVSEYEESQRRRQGDGLGNGKVDLLISNH